MKKFCLIVTSLLFLILLGNNHVSAQQSPDRQETRVSITPDPSRICANDTIRVSISGSNGIAANQEYVIALWKPGEGTDIGRVTETHKATSNNTSSVNFEFKPKPNTGDWTFKVWRVTDRSSIHRLAVVGGGLTYIPDPNAPTSQGTYTVVPSCDSTGGTIKLWGPKVVRTKQSFNIVILNVEQGQNYYSYLDGAAFGNLVKQLTVTASEARTSEQLQALGVPGDQITPYAIIDPYPQGIDMKAGGFTGTVKRVTICYGLGTQTGPINTQKCQFPYQVTITENEVVDPQYGIFDETTVLTGQPTQNPSGPPTVPPPSPPCAEGHRTPVYDDNGKQVGTNCSAVMTGFGFAVSTTPEGVIKDIYAVLLGISGGIAVIMIMIAGYQLIASHGEPDKVKEAKERITAAIVGLLFIIFSFLILEVILVGLIRVPGIQPSGQFVTPDANRVDENGNPLPTKSIHCFGPEVLRYYQTGSCKRSDAISVCNQALRDFDDADATENEEKMKNAQELMQNCRSAGILDSQNRIVQ